MSVKHMSLCEGSEGIKGACQQSGKKSIWSRERWNKTGYYIHIYNKESY